MLAALTGVDSQVIEHRRVKITSLPFVFFAAVHADDATKRPRRQTRGTQELPAATVGVAGGDERRQLRRAAAERTSIVGAGQLPANRCDAAFGKPAGVGLQRGFCKKILIRRRVPVADERVIDVYLGR